MNLRMKKINVLTEVEEDIYDAVVLPHKKTKSFSRLIATLLRGYMENAYVKAYAEGTLDEVETESVNALDSIISDMQGSLATMGVFTNELKNATQEGVEVFSNKVQSTPSKSFRGNGFGGVAQVDESPDKDDLKSTVEELKSQNQEIMGLLQKLISGDVQIPKIPGEVVPEIVKEPVKSSFSSSVGSGSVNTSISPKLMESSDDADMPTLKEVSDGDESSVDANDVMASLLMGNMMSF